MNFNYKRRVSSEVRVGDIKIGGQNPVRLQSMTNTNTNDTEASAAQAMRIADAGGELVRLTTQGEREATNMAHIRARIEEEGRNIPLVADVHFNPKAAYVAATVCHKVRINPGNFVDPGRTFQKLDFTDEEYACEIERIRTTLVPFLEICRAHGTALRLGVNHGSLSDRIMSRYGDTPAGMVESVMEFLRICREVDFTDIVISIKASNCCVMTDTVRLLSDTMAREDMHFPLHLGVTEAGNDSEGRIKSAVGIGALLADGLGDTIRVSLSEAPEREIPVARLLRDYISLRSGHAHIVEPATRADFPMRASAEPISGFETSRWPLVAGHDFPLQDIDMRRVDASSDPEAEIADQRPILITSGHVNAPAEIASWLERYAAAGGKSPIVISLRYDDSDRETVEVKSGADFGTLLLAGYGNAIHLDAPALDAKVAQDTALAILQATRLRMTKPEYIACPGCGRTLFALEETLRKVKEATAHMTGLKIGVMGCIVNGPGEMADADYGYVGAGPGRVSIYKGKTLVKKNIPTEEALPELLKLIESDR